MKKDNSKMVWTAVVIIIIAIIIIWAVRKNSSAPVANTEVTTTANQEALEATEDLSTGSIDAPKSPTGSAQAISYAAALLKYKDKRIQLDDKCQASPISMTFKNNTNIMIDNRSAVGRTVKIGSTFVVKGYGFKIVNLSSGTLPVTYLLDCDRSQNVATILLQK